MTPDIVGVDAETGQFLWSHPQTNPHNIHANSPVFKDGSVLASSEKAGSVKLSLNDDGKIKNIEWTNAESDPLQGGVVIVDGYAYTAGSTNPRKLDIISKTAITAGTGEHFSYPVIHNGRLYVRRGNTMIVFNITG